MEKIFIKFISGNTEVFEVTEKEMEVIIACYFRESHLVINDWIINSKTIEYIRPVKSFKDNQ